MDLYVICGLTCRLWDATLQLVDKRSYMLNTILIYQQESEID